MGIGVAIRTAAVRRPRIGVAPYVAKEEEAEEEEKEEVVDASSAAKEETLVVAAVGVRPRRPPRLKLFWRTGTGANAFGSASIASLTATEGVVLTRRGRERGGGIGVASGDMRCKRLCSAVADKGSAAVDAVDPTVVPSSDSSCSCDPKKRLAGAGGGARARSPPHHPPLGGAPPRAAAVGATPTQTSDPWRRAALRRLIRKA